MKLLFASDIHGDAKACAAVLARAEAEGAERIILLGDLLYHGPRNPLPPGFGPKETAALLNENAEKLLCVRGNCDAEVDQMVLDFPLMADYRTVAVEEETLFLTHGHLENLPIEAGYIVLQGHTHVPLCEHKPGGWWLLNPGSVSIPKENSPHSYLLLKDGTFYWKTLGGETYRTMPLFG